MKKQPGKPVKVPAPQAHQEIIPPVDPEELVIRDEDPDLIPEEDPFETPANELPPAGEGP